VLPFFMAAAPVGWTRSAGFTQTFGMRIVPTADAGGVSGGSDDPILMNKVPSHVHGFSGVSGANSVDHSHGFSGTTGYMNQNASHGHGVSDPGHSHSTVVSGTPGSGFAYGSGNVANGATGASVTGTSINGTDTNGTAIDCAGFHYALGIFHLGATTAAFDSLAVQESDDNSSWSTDITAFTFSTVPSATDDDGFFTCHIDLRKRKRYLRWHADPGAAATLFTAFFILLRGDEAPNSVTTANVVQALYG